VARALAADPAILLMDEPFGALDPVTRAELQHEFAELARGLAKTIVFVTHDLHEALRLGSRIVLLAAGKIVADAPPEEFLRVDSSGSAGVCNFIWSGRRSAGMSVWEFMVSHRAEIFEATLAHLFLVVVSMAIAISIGVRSGCSLSSKRNCERSRSDLPRYYRRFRAWRYSGF